MREEFLVGPKPEVHFSVVGLSTTADVGPRKHIGPMNFGFDHESSLVVNRLRAGRRNHMKTLDALNMRVPTWREYEFTHLPNKGRKIK